MSYGDAPTEWSSCSIGDFTGYYLAAKWGYKTLSGLSTAFKTYVLPLMWQINFKEEYGEWAGKRHLLSNFAIMD